MGSLDRIQLIAEILYRKAQKCVSWDHEVHLGYLDEEKFLSHLNKTHNFIRRNISKFEWLIENIPNFDYRVYGDTVIVMLPYKEDVLRFKLSN